jgi:hypothetical protein
VEGLAEIAELICRYAVTESLYSQAASKSDEGLKRAVVKLYASILGYLSKANQYFKQGTASQFSHNTSQIHMLTRLIRANDQKRSAY